MNPLLRFTWLPALALALASAGMLGCTTGQTFDVAAPQDEAGSEGPIDVDNSDGGPNAQPDSSTTLQPEPPDRDCIIDSDTDGYSDPTRSCAGRPTTPSPFGVDCDDDNPAIHEHSPESCNGIDDDCDEAIDEGRDCEIEVTRSAEAEVLDFNFNPGFVAIDTDADGNRYGVGLNIFGSVSTYQIEIASQDASGAERWSIALPFTEDDESWSVGWATIAVAGERLYLLAAGKELTLPEGSPVARAHDVFVLALDAGSGAVEWVTELEGGRGDGFLWDSLAIDVAGGAIFVAAPFATEVERDAVLRYARLELDGTIAWQREPEQRSVLTQLVTRPSALAATDAGELYIAGDTTSMLIWDGCEIDNDHAFIVALDAQGECMWKQESTTDQIDSLKLRDLAVTPAGDLVVVGDTERVDTFAGADLTPTVSPDARLWDHSLGFVLGLTADGELRFTRTYNDGPHDHHAYAVDVAPDGGLYVGLGLQHFIDGVNWQAASTDVWLTGLQELGVVDHLSPDGEEIWSRDVTLLFPEDPRVSRSSDTPVEDLVVLPDGDIFAIPTGRRVVLHPR